MGKAGSDYDDETGTPQREALAAGEPRPRPEFDWATNDGEMARYHQVDERVVNVAGEPVETTRLHAQFWGLVEVTDDAGRFIWHQPGQPPNETMSH